MSRSSKSSGDELNAFAADVMRLSSMLTRGRDALPASYLKNPGLRKAYLLYFLPANTLKIHIPLGELSLHPEKVLQKERLRVLDIGSGPGTAILGSLEFFAHRERKPFLEFTAVDQVGENLREAELLFLERRKTHGMGTSLHTIRSEAAGLETRLKEQYDLIILSNVLNELFHGDDERTGKRVGSVSRILRRLLAPDGACIIIEPALRETSREMLMVRDGLLAEGFHLYSPCFAEEKCPALASPRDWCHEDVPWDPPEIVKETDRRTGLRKDSLKFSYLVMRKDGLSLGDVCGRDALRVVSEPLVSKGKREFFVCGSGGRWLVTRLDKDAAPANEVFGTAKRGDILRFDNAVNEGKRLRVGKGTSIRTSGADQVPGPARAARIRHTPVSGPC